MSSLYLDFDTLVKFSFFLSRWVDCAIVCTNFKLCLRVIGNLVPFAFASCT
jgi:hypothetical protein